MKEKKLNQEEMIKSYIFEVTKRVPQKQRKDIELELSSLIEDQLENNSDKNIESILISLGSPKLLAENYLDHKRYLIGPAYFDFYVSLLKIVIPAVILGLTIALTLAFITSSDQTGIEFITKLLGSWWSASLQVFAFITVGFSISEYVNKGKGLNEDWHPYMLTKVVEDDKIVKIGDSIAGIIFMVIGFIIFNLTPNLVAFHMFENGVTSILLFNQSIYPSILLWINIGFLIALIKEVSKIIIRYYNKLQLIIQTILGFLGVVIAIILLSIPNLINPTIVSELASAGMNFDFDMYEWLNRTKTIILYIVVIAFGMEVVFSIIKFKKNH